MGMDYTKYASKLAEYMEEAAKVKESYDTAKEGILEEYEVRQKVFNDVNERLKEVQEAFERGGVTENALTKIKKDHERAEKVVKELKFKLNEIDQFMKARLESVVLKLNVMKQKYNEEIEKEILKLKDQLLKAKYDFLTRAVTVRKVFRNLSKNEYELQDLNKDFGPHSVLTSQNAFDLLFPVITDKNGASINKEELHDALCLGKISPELEEEVNDANNKKIRP